jgi:hypothetical protein
MNNMTPKEKAEDLFVTFYQRLPDSVYSNNGAKSEAKQCALICCNEVLGYMGADRGTAFWNEVKQEIEKL